MNTWTELPYPHLSPSPSMEEIPSFKMGLTNNYEIINEIINKAFETNIILTIFSLLI